MEIKYKKDLKHEIPDTDLGDEYPYAMSAEIFLTKQLFLYSERVMPYSKASAPHYHRSIDEVVYITKGEFVAVEGEDEKVLKTGDFALFEANSQKLHYLENRTDIEAEFVIFRRSIEKNDVIFNV